ncbi:MAG: GmrSD restriction endonuclease domain-containing protein [Candidatus Rokuibacteriota bacterium]
MPKIDTTVGKLVDMITGGELRLPEMQRRYVWRATRVRDLLDSLYRGYPSGTILVWETEREMPSRDVAVEQGQSPFKGHKLLLDGQQRLTSLAAVLEGKPIVVRNRKRPIEILFNLEHPEGPPVEVTEVEDDAAGREDEEPEVDDEDDAPTVQERLKKLTFVVASRALLADPHWVRVSDVFNPGVSDGQILRSLVKSLDDPLYDKYTRRLQRVRKIRDYPYVMHLLDKDLSYEEVAEIFVRVNSLGVKLRGSDLALAQITSRWQDSLKLFEGFQEECEEKWFTLDLGLIVRALVVCATGQSRFKTASTIPVSRLQTAWEHAKNGMRFAVNFLRSNAGIEDESLLSSPFFFIALAYYAHAKNYRLVADEEGELRRWLYIANARGHYSRGSSESLLDADLSAIRRAGGPAALLELLRQQVGRFEIEPADLAGRGERAGLFPMAYLALKERGAKDWRTRLGLSLTHQGRQHFIEYHHIFPKSHLKKADYPSEEIHEIANMAFVSGATNRKIASTLPEKYLAEVVEEQGEEALRAHCIPLDPRLWKLDAFREFLEYRRAALAAAINELVGQTGARPFGVSLGDLLAHGENDEIEFKTAVRWDSKQERHNPALEMVVPKTLAGFLNGRGGVLVLGVDDHGRVVGLEHDYRTLRERSNRDGYQQFLVNLISVTLGKPVFQDLTISFEEANGKEVCIVRAKSSLTPVYLKEKEGGQTAFYVRTGNATQALGIKEATEYIRAHWKGGP